jgi:hypothetical protein
MEQSLSLLYFFAVAGIMTHELDAIHEHEWRFFFPMLGDQAAFRLFTIVHIPLFGLILWGVPQRNFQIGLDLFLIIHVGLHWILRNHPKIEFKSLFSRVIIVGTGLVAAAHLFLLLRV